MHTVQHLQFTFPTILEKLFYTTSGGDHVCQVKEDGLHLTAYGRQVSLNLTSLFNSFPAEHFLTNTRARQVYLQLRFSGRADSISVYRKTQWNDETVHRQLDPAAGEILLGPFPLEKNTKRYAFSIETRADIILHAGCWRVDAEPQDKSVDVCITTFKKEHYVTANVAALLAYPPLAAMNYRITVVDNGSTLDADDFPRADNFTLIRQANLGGTGGFMRGLMDAREKQSDYILFVDDDILLAPEMIYRAVAIAQIAKPKRAFGGMMLHYTRKDKIHEQGAACCGKSATSSRPSTTTPSSKKHCNGSRQQKKRRRRQRQTDGKKHPPPGQTTSTPRCTAKGIPISAAGGSTWRKPARLPSCPTTSSNGTTSAPRSTCANAAPPSASSRPSSSGTKTSASSAT